MGPSPPRFLGRLGDPTTTCWAAGFARDGRVAARASMPLESRRAADPQPRHDRRKSDHRLAGPTTRSRRCWRSTRRSVLLSHTGEAHAAAGGVLHRLSPHRAARRRNLVREIRFRAARWPAQRRVSSSSACAAAQAISVNRSGDLLTASRPASRPRCAHRLGLRSRRPSSGRQSAERALIGAPLDADAALRAGRLAVTDAAPIDDWRGSAGYAPQHPRRARLPRPRAAGSGPRSGGFSGRAGAARNAAVRNGPRVFPARSKPGSTACSTPLEGARTQHCSRLCAKMPA